MPVLTNNLLLESERQQIISSLKDFSGYSSRSSQCCDLDGTDSFSDF